MFDNIWFSHVVCSSRNQTRNFMNDTTLIPDLKSLFNQNPKIVYFGGLLIFTFWMSTRLTQFDKQMIQFDKQMTQFDKQLTQFDTRLTNVEVRLEATEKLVRDINDRQLPEIRNEIKNLQKEMDERFEKVDQRFDKIELSLNTIITYLSTKK